MEDWLKRRLSPVKDKTDRWTELSSAIQVYWEENFDPYHNDLLNLRSVYTMTRPDLAMKMRELGDYFLPDWPNEYDQPLAVAWREGEILRKSTEYIIKSTFRRNFSGVDVQWVQLYAPKVGDYGSKFISETSALGVGETLTDDYWLTSRGKVSVELAGMYSSGWVMASFSPVVDKLVNKLKPLHIVYDGIVFEWNGSQDIDISIGEVVLGTIISAQFDLSFNKRYDITRADVQSTDTPGSALTVTGHTHIQYYFEVGIINVGPFLDELPLDFDTLDYNFWPIPDDVAFITDVTSVEIPIVINNQYLQITTFGAQNG